MWVPLQSQKSHLHHFGRVGRGLRRALTCADAHCATTIGGVSGSRLRCGSLARQTIPTSSGYTAVVRPHVVHRARPVLHTLSPESTVRPPASSTRRRANTPSRRSAAMHCPFCRHTDSRVMDSRTTDDGSSIRRRRQCPECGRRFTTIETASLTVDQALRRERAVQPGQGPRRRPQGLPGPPGHRGRPRPARPARRGVHPPAGAGRGRGPRGGPGDPRTAARARRGRLPAVRQRLPGVRVASRTSSRAITLLRAERDATGTEPDAQHRRHAAEAEHRSRTAPGTTRPLSVPPPRIDTRQHHQGLGRPPDMTETAGARAGARKGSGKRARASRSSASTPPLVCTPTTR